MKRKYQNLEVVSLLSTFFGLTIFFIGSFSSIYNILISGRTGFSFFGVTPLITSIFIGLMLIAMGELITVAIDIESNTRANISSEKNINPIVQNTLSKSNVNINPTVQPSNVKPDQAVNRNATCPVCHSLVKQKDYDCWSCHTVFSGDSTQKPIP